MTGLNKMMHYERFSAEDFAMDPDFVKWVRDPHGPEGASWNDWLAQHPEREHAVAEARRLVALLTYDVARPGGNAKATVKENIDRLLAESQARPAAPIRKLAWYRWAAALTGFLVLVVVGMVVLSPSETIVSTAYGETQTVALEDGSTVTLNGNSSIRYRDLASAEIREVQLTGEAFFQVRPVPDQKKFVVVADRLRVEVAGTEFNVSSRLGKTSVVLHSGAVSVAVDKPDGAEAMTMAPGDMVEYTPFSQKLMQKVVEPSHYTSWTRNVLTFDAVSIEDIATTLTLTYGYDITVAEEVRPLLFTGTVPADNLDILLNGLRKTHGLHIIVEGNRIVIER